MSTNAWKQFQDLTIPLSVQTAERAVPVAGCLLQGWITVYGGMFRTEAAAEAIKRIVAEMLDFQLQVRAPYLRWSSGKKGRVRIKFLVVFAGILIGKAAKEIYHPLSGCNVTTEVEVGKDVLICMAPAFPRR